jgi:AcrR family transcriptional regulator
MPTATAILDAALHAFTEKGDSAATIDDVRGRSGAIIGSI